MNCYPSPLGLLPARLFAALWFLVLLGGGESACAVEVPRRGAAATNVPAGITSSDWQSIRAAYEAGRHSFQPVAGGWQARNPGQQWLTTFDRRGSLARPQHGEWTWGLELQSYGFGDPQTPVAGTPAVEAVGQRLSYQWDRIVQEWFVNDPRGLEHGFTVAQRPERGVEPQASKSELAFTLTARGDLTPHVSADAQSVAFQNAAGDTVLNYAGLKVWDADGIRLASRFEQAGAKGFRLLVDERTARYPLTIDPIAQQAYLKASNTGPFDWFGWSVAVSGDTVVIGAPQEGSSATGLDGSQADNSAPESGAAYVFVRSAGVWTQQAYLKPSNTETDDHFGYSVSISGDTVVIGALGEDSNATGVNGNQSDNSSSNSGAAYVFIRTAGLWTQSDYLKASNTGAGDMFGWSVAISGETIVVGTPFEASSAAGVGGNQADNGAANSGAAYVFIRSDGAWIQSAYLKASNTGANDNFGYSAAVSGDSIVIGAPGEDSKTTGPGRNQLDNSAGNSGAVYVFNRSAGTWDQQAYLKASNSGTADLFGTSVSVSGDAIVVGAPGEGSNATGVDGDQTSNNLVGAGAAYVFVRSDGAWFQSAYLKASNTGANDNFGSSAAVSGDTIVIGAPGEDSNATGIGGNQANNSASGSGAAYLFIRSDGVWGQHAYLKASNTGPDEFGISVAIWDDSVAIGALLEDSNATGVGGNQASNAASNSGAAYVFGLEPDIAVAQAGPIADGGSVDFGSGAAGGSQTLTFTITNPGSFELNSLAITKDGAHADDFTVSPLSGTSVPFGGGTVTFTVTFTPTASGIRTAALHVASNVTGAKNPYDINLTGTAVPVVLGVNPSHGPSSGGSEVTVAGTGFTGVPTVTFGGLPANVINATDTELTVVTPPHASGPAAVVVTVGPFVSNPLTYTYDPVPVLTGLTPAHGPSAGGNEVLLNGSDLSGATGVTFGGLAAPITGRTATSLTVTAPPHASGPAAVVVTAGPFVSNALTYTYQNSAPFAGADVVRRSPTATVAKVLRSALLANDSDADLDPLTLVAVGDAQPAGATVAIAAGFVIYTAPAANAGDGSFTYTLSDGSGGHTAIGTVTVHETAATSGNGAPNALSIAPHGTDFVVTFLGVPGGSFRVHYSVAGPPDHVWQEFSPPAIHVASPNGIFTHTDINPPGPGRFYRAVAE